MSSSATRPHTPAGAAAAAAAAVGSVLIIGYGNPLRGDDAAGYLVADRLLNRARAPGLEVIRAHQLTPEMAEPLSRAVLAIFVDAACDSPPGVVRFRCVAPARSSAPSLCHHLTPAQLLSDARTLFGRAPEAWAITVGGRSWGYSDQLSPIVSHSVPEVVKRIDLLIAARLAKEMCVTGGARHA